MSHGPPDVKNFFQQQTQTVSNILTFLSHTENVRVMNVISSIIYDHALYAIDLI